MVHRSQTMRLSREVIEDVEWFTVTWIHSDPAAPKRVAHYPTEPRFRAWLIEEQGYRQTEADETIAQLRQR